MVCDCNEWDLFTSVCSTLCSRLVVEVDWYDTVEIKTMKLWYVIAMNEICLQVCVLFAAEVDWYNTVELKTIK